MRRKKAQDLIRFWAVSLNQFFDFILRTHTERSKRFYEKHGFNEISYKDIEPEDKCYIMKLNLEKN